MFFTLILGGWNKLKIIKTKSFPYNFKFQDMRGTAIGLTEFCWQNFEQNREVKALSIMPANRARL